MLTRPDLVPAVLARTRQLMNAAVADCLLEGFEARVEQLHLPDPGDRHVLAAAIHGGAHVIVTMNLRDFPQALLLSYAVEAQHPDDFVLGLIDADPEAVVSVVVEQAAALKNPPRTPVELLETLRNQGLVRSVEKLRGLLDVYLG